MCLHVWSSCRYIGLLSKQNSRFLRHPERVFILCRSLICSGSEPFIPEEQLLSAEGEIFLLTVSIYCMMELRTSLHVSIMHPRHHSSWTGIPFLLGYFFRDGSFCINDVTAFIMLFFIFFLELSSLVLRNKSHPSLLVGDFTRSFLQVKCISCMVRNNS